VTDQCRVVLAIKLAFRLGVRIPLVRVFGKKRLAHSSRMVYCEVVTMEEVLRPNCRMIYLTQTGLAA
jgi:hypothetical protein